MKRTLFFTSYHLILIIAALFLPLPNFGKYGSLIAHYSTYFWTLALQPLWFFSLVIAICRLSRQQRLLSLIGRMLLYTALFYLLIMLAVNLVEVFFPLNKLTFISDNQQLPALPAISWTLILDNLLAPFSFLPLKNGTGHLLVLSILAIFLGYLLVHDREVSVPTYNLCDSLSRIAYRFNTVAYRLIFIPLSFFTFYGLQQLSQLPVASYRRPLLLLLCSSLLLLLVVAPAGMKLFYRKSKPYQLLFLNIKSLITALISGESRLALASLLLEQKENCGLSRTQTGLSTPLLFLFTRVGSAAMLTLAFAIVYASQNRWPMSLPEIFYWRLIMPIILSSLFVLIDFNPVTVLMLIPFTLYGEELGYGNTVLIPLLPLMQRFAITIDIAVIAMINQLLVAREK